ncbi:MAG: alkaline phosphatase family protein [Candidatus Eisenbacteria bacterium]
MKRERLTLAFFVDALGWRLAQEFGCFRKIAPHAYRQRTILGYSCAAQPTILTGLSPAEHGHWAMFERSERSELAPLRHFDLLPDAVGRHRRFRRRLLAWHRGRSGFTGYYNFYRIPFRLFREFDLSEKRDIYAPGGFDAFPDGSGPVESVFDVLARDRVPYRVWNWRSDLDQALSELEEALRGGPPIRFALLYTAVIDALLHEHVGDASVVGAALSELENKLSRAVARARDSYSDVEVLIFSDHGMAETRSEVDLMSAVAALGLEHERDYLAFYDSTMGRFWFRSDRARDAVTGALESMDCGTVLSDDDLEREGVLMEDRRCGELVFLMNPGTLVVPSYMGARAPRGMHGFTPEHEDSYAMIASSAPLDPAPSAIADTFRIMRDSIGR